MVKETIAEAHVVSIEEPSKVLWLFPESKFKVTMSIFSLVITQSL